MAGIATATIEGSRLLQSLIPSVAGGIPTTASTACGLPLTTLLPAQAGFCIRYRAVAMVSIAAVGPLIINIAFYGLRLKDRRKE